MYNGGGIIAGLIGFIALVTFPFYANLGKTSSAPAAPLSAPDTLHIGNISVGDTRAEHMKLLYQWRDEVVRTGARLTEFQGIELEKSIQKGCLSCHVKQDYCDKCHDYVGVTPNCWDCHFAADESQSWK